MNKINFLADAINHVPMVRVIKENDTNYGKEFDIALHNYEDKEVTIISNHIYDYVRYQYSEIQFLTPVQYEWRYIGFGDKVNWYEVFGYCWFCDSWNLNVSKNYISSYVLHMRNITSFEPLHKLTPKIELSTEELLEELKRRWVVTSGNIINQ